MIIQKFTSLEVWNVGYNYLHFKDTGTGVKAELLPNLFDRFYTTTGTGVGLAFCKQVINSFNGEIRCETEPNQYTEFILQFPQID